MATNDFQPFAYGGAANVVSQSAYVALTSILQNGFSSGVAQSAQLNKVWRQSSIMAAVLAQFSSDYSGQNSTDDGTTATLETNLIAAIRGVTKTSVLLTDTGTANAYTASNVPPLTSGQQVNGLVQQIVIAHANTGASTYAPDGLTAAPIYGLGLQPLQGGELALGGTAVLMRATIAAVNSGNPIWVLMECAGGAQQIAPATQSQHAAQATQAQSGILGYLTGIGGTANAITATLTPAATTIPTGARFRFTPASVNTAATTITVNSFAAASILKLGNPLQGGELSPNHTYDLTFNGTAYDLSQVAIPYFQTATVNGNTEVDALPNGTGSGASFRAWGAAGQTNCTYGALTLSSTDLRVDSGIVGSGSYVPLTFYANGGEKARFDTSSNLLIGKTTNAFGTVGNIFSTVNGSLTVTAAHSTTAIPVNVVSASGTETAMSFSYNSVVVGSIQMTSSATSYLTSSDYRLKRNVESLTGGLARLQNLPVHRFEFVSNPGMIVDGFLAHEAQAVVPESVVGAKDATRVARNVVLDQSGNLLQESISQGDFEADQSSYPAGSSWAASATVPVYQSIDQSKLVPLLVAAVQDLAAQVAALQAKVGA